VIAVLMLAGTAATAAAAAAAVGCGLNIWYVWPHYVRDKCCDGELQDKAGHQLRRQQQPSQLRVVNSGRAQRPQLRHDWCYYLCPYVAHGPVSIPHQFLQAHEG
jgi:hypothetical protein